MFLSNVSLFDFRNYRELDLPLERSVTVLTGGNAQGKTNLVEAVALAALARSPRTQQTAELIRFGQPQARVTCMVQRESGMEELDIRISAGGRPEQARTSKRFQVNGRARSATDMVGELRVVLFWPDDLQLVKGSSELRRRFLNTLLTQLERDHVRALSEYQHLLEQRNALLKAVREGAQPASSLDYWTNNLATVGAAIMVERQRRVLELQPIAAAFQRELTDDREHLELRYRPAGARVGEAPPDAVAEQLRVAMARSRDEEIARGQTVVGPQRDDLEVWLDGRESRLYASQGQQRTAILSLKLAELNYLAEATGEQPVLLLDDVMSELDQARRERLLAALEPGPQAMITAADLHDLPQSFLDQAAIFHVEGGRIHA
jgi:DNA replication and repair protein RecF